MLSWKLSLCSDCICAPTQEVQTSKKGLGKVFFAELEFKESQALFHRLNANTLPWIVHVSPGLNIGADGPLKIKHEDVVGLPTLLALQRCFEPRRRQHCRGLFCN